MYAALRCDLDEKHHVDMVFSYYNEAAERVEYTADCHKIALAAKSPVIRQLLLQHQCMERHSLYPHKRSCNPVMT